MKILVTGGSGFIGYNTALSLMRHGKTVAVTCSNDENKIHCDNKYLPSFFREKVYESKHPIYQYNDAVFHFACASKGKKEDIIDFNVKKSMELFKRMAAAGCKKFVVASDAALYAEGSGPFKEDDMVEPTSPVLESKIILERQLIEFAKENEVSVVILRYSKVYGPGEHHKKSEASLIHNIVSKSSNQEVHKIQWDGSQLNDYIYINDVVEANLKALEYKGSGIFNIANGKSYTTLAVISAVEQNFGGVSYRFASDESLSDRRQNFDVRISTDKARDELKFRATTCLSDGVMMYCKNWM